MLQPNFFPSQNFLLLLWKINCCDGTKTVYKITKLMQQFGKLFTRLQQGPNIFIGTYVHLNEYNQ